MARAGGFTQGEDVPTSEAARIAGVAPDVLRKWKMRGFLKLAPQGVSGQGRGVECFWSQAAVAEAKARADHNQAERERHKRQKSSS